MTSSWQRGDGVFKAARTSMDHYRIDAAKYQRHMALFKTNNDRITQLLESIGSLARVQRAVRDAVVDGRAPPDLLNVRLALINAIAEQMAPDTLHRPEPAVEVDQGLLDELVDLLVKSCQLMRFKNFIIPPGGVAAG